MAGTVTLTAYNAPYGLDATQSRQYLHGLVGFSTGTYVTGGFLPSYSPIKDQSGQAVLLGTLNVNPDTMWIESIAGSGYTFGYNKASGKIQVFVSAAAGSALEELPSGTSLATLNADTVEFEAEWVRQ
jgi:hypothetical protein